MAEAQNFNLAAKNHTTLEFSPGQQQMVHGDVYNKQNIKQRTTTTMLSTLKIFCARSNNGTSSTLLASTHR